MINYYEIFNLQPEMDVQSIVERLDQFEDRLRQATQSGDNSAETQQKIEYLEKAYAIFSSNETKLEYDQQLFHEEKSEEEIREEKFENALEDAINFYNDYEYELMEAALSNAANFYNRVEKPNAMYHFLQAVAANHKQQNSEAITEISQAIYQDNQFPNAHDFRYFLYLEEYGKYDPKTVKAYTDFANILINDDIDRKHYFADRLVQIGYFVNGQEYLHKKASLQSLKREKNQTYFKTANRLLGLIPENTQTINQVKDFNDYHQNLRNKADAERRNKNRIAKLQAQMEQEILELEESFATKHQKLNRTRMISIGVIILLGLIFMGLMNFMFVIAMAIITMVMYYVGKIFFYENKFLRIVLLLIFPIIPLIAPGIYDELVDFNRLLYSVIIFGIILFATWFGFKWYLREEEKALASEINRIQASYEEKMYT